jgi:hypothetical protein
MLRRVRSRLTVVLISGVMVAALELAEAALGAHTMTSPTAVGLFKAKNHSGFVAFTWNEYGGYHGTKPYSVQYITQFRFHDGCTKSKTKIKKTIHIRHNRFSYHVDGVRIASEPNDVTIAGKVHLTDGAASVIKGTITLSDPDCAADPNGVITFRAR